MTDPTKGVSERKAVSTSQDAASAAGGSGAGDAKGDGKASPAALKIAFTKPTKQLKSASDMDAWRRSQLYTDVTRFIMVLNEKIKGTSKATQRTPSAKIKLLVEYLQAAKKWIDDIPPLPQAMRFGNKAFCQWHARMLKSLPEFLEPLVGSDLHKAGASEELAAYLDGSFGHPQRIDYGTGHELAFVTFLAALDKIGVITADDHLCVLLDVFETYLDLLRQLQRTYWLEPAGSKGAWGLDDYQFLGFLWGAAQLSKQSEIAPKAVLNADTVKLHANSYMYFGCIAFVTEMKTGPFNEHSSVLSTIADLPNWLKANQGLIKMYDGEVLSKFPIAQHVMFGGIFPFASAGASAAAGPGVSSAAGAGSGTTMGSGTVRSSAALPGVAGVPVGVAPGVRPGVAVSVPLGVATARPTTKIDWQQQYPPLLRHPPRAAPAGPQPKTAVPIVGTPGSVILGSGQQSSTVAGAGSAGQSKS